MRPDLQNLKSEISQQLPYGWEAVTALLYLRYASTDVAASEGVRQQYEIIDEYTEGLPFLAKDRILSASNAICAEYEEAAFSTGFLTGAKLILDLLDPKP